MTVDVQQKLSMRRMDDVCVCSGVSSSLIQRGGLWLEETAEPFGIHAGWTHEHDGQHVNTVVLHLVKAVLHGAAVTIVVMK